jgi:hypothetical protein
MAAFVVDVSIAEVGFIVAAARSARRHYVAHAVIPGMVPRKAPERAADRQPGGDGRPSSERTEFYHDFLRRYGIFHAMGASCGSGTLASLCGVQRRAGGPLSQPSCNA